MSSLSIRKLPKKIEKALLKAVKKQGKTKTEIVIDALTKALNTDDGTSKLEELKRFFGKMTEQEFEEFKKSCTLFEEIDESFWK